MVNVILELSLYTDEMGNRNRTHVFEHRLMSNDYAEFFLTAQKYAPNTEILFFFGYDLACQLKDIKMKIISNADDVQAFKRLYPDEKIGSEALSNFLEWEIMRQVHTDLHGDQCRLLGCQLDEPEYSSQSDEIIEGTQLFDQWVQYCKESQK